MVNVFAVVTVVRRGENELRMRALGRRKNTLSVDDDDDVVWLKKDGNVPLVGEGVSRNCC